LDVNNSAYRSASSAEHGFQVLLFTIDSEHFSYQ
jgi:hypothetical protein